MLAPPSGLKMERPISERGAHIPIRCSFTGIKNLKFLTIQHSYSASEFVLFEDQIETTVHLKTRSNISELELINVRNGLGGRIIIIDWKNSPLNFQAQIEGDDILLEVLRFFVSKNVPLGNEAKRLLAAVK